MRTALLILFFCLAQADDIRWEFQQFKSQLEAALNLQITQLKTELTRNITQLKRDLTQEINQLKSEVKLKYQCSSGWEKFGDSCYYMSTEQKTWQETKRDCQNQGADLVVITSKEEQDFVVRLVGRNKVVWLGLTDREREGEWKWVDGTALTSPTYWYHTEPNNHGAGEDCGAIHNGVWWDGSCGDSRYWICEKAF